MTAFKAFLIGAAMVLGGEVLVLLVGVVVAGAAAQSSLGPDGMPTTTAAEEAAQSFQFAVNMQPWIMGLAVLIAVCYYVTRKLASPAPPK